MARSVCEKDKIRLTDDQLHELVDQLVCQDSKDHVDRTLSRYAQTRFPEVCRVGGRLQILRDMDDIVRRRVVCRTLYPHPQRNQRSWRGGSKWTYFEDVYVLDRLFVHRYHPTDSEVDLRHPPSVYTAAVLLQRSAQEIEERVQVLKRARADGVVASSSETQVRQGFEGI